jgi:hypothetical protein
MHINGSTTPDQESVKLHAQGSPMEIQHVGASRPSVKQKKKKSYYHYHIFHLFKNIEFALELKMGCVGMMI